MAVRAQYRVVRGSMARGSKYVLKLETFRKVFAQKFAGIFLHMLDVDNFSVFPLHFARISISRSTPSF